MKEIRLWELSLLVVMTFVVGSIGFFYYTHFTDKYQRDQEKWKNDVTAIINHNIQQGRMVTIGTPQMQSPPPQYPPKQGVPGK
jgi:formate/nitrite transporter FocA (FNT family)